MRKYETLKEKKLKQILGGSNNKFWEKVGEGLGKAASFYWEYTLN